MKLRQHLALSAAALLTVIQAHNADASTLRFAFPHGTAGSPAPPPAHCPQGTTTESFDGCNNSDAGAEFISSTLISDYALDVNGSTQTIQHRPAFNVAGEDFAVGLIGTATVDPRTQTVSGVAVISGTTLSWVTQTNGGTPQAGMTVWDDPSGGHIWYADQPKIVSCTGSTPSYTCTLDKSETAHGGFTAFASFWPGCIVTPGTASSADTIGCKFQNSSGNFTATLTGVEFGPIGGHNGTVLTAASASNGLYSGHVRVLRSHLAMSQYTNGNNLLSINGTANPNISLDLEDSTCDGGNVGTPLTGPFTYSTGGACAAWQSQGSAAARNSVTVKNVYVHDFAANPFNFQLAYNDIYEQSIVFNRVSLNCPAICHGAPTEYGTTIQNATSTVKMYNITLIYPYGFQNGGITAGMAVLGGIGSQVNIGIDIKGATIISNISNNPGHAVMSVMIDPFRVGKITSFVAQHIYLNGVGTATCFNAGGDLQNPSGSGVGAMSAVAGQGKSIWTLSGFSGQVPLPYPGQTIVTGNPSSAPVFTGSLADNGDGTSTLTITGTPPSTMAAKTQIVALRLADIVTHPTLVVSGSGSSYIVSNGSGSGETRAAEVFNIAQALAPYGSTNPNTGLPTTSVAGTAGTNGTWLALGERTQGSTNTWAVLSPAIGNVTTIDTDISDNWEMATAGSGGAITVDGINLTHGACPNAHPA